jgi:hypothetical protein
MPPGELADDLSRALDTSQYDNLTTGEHNPRPSGERASTGGSCDQEEND